MPQAPVVWQYLHQNVCNGADLFRVFVYGVPVGLVRFTCEFSAQRPLELLFGKRGAVSSAGAHHGHTPGVAQLHGAVFFDQTQVGREHPIGDMKPHGGLHDSHPLFHARRIRVLVQVAVRAGDHMVPVQRIYRKRAHRDAWRQAGEGCFKRRTRLLQRYTGHGVHTAGNVPRDAEFENAV